MIHIGDTSAFLDPPDLANTRTMDELGQRLRLLKAWAGDPSYDTLARRVNARRAQAGISEQTSKSTVADLFAPTRLRPDEQLLLDVVWALHPSPAYVTQWRQAIRIVRGEAEASTFVNASDHLPDDHADFVGREQEIAGLVADLERLPSSRVLVIEGLAGVGKTWLAIRIGHELARGRPFDHVLFVNLRGFHHDPEQPPADAAAVLDVFLRLLGVPGNSIPHDLDCRIRRYNEQVGSGRTLVVLDNAASVEHVRPLLGDHCLTIITSRNSLDGLPNARGVHLGVFAPEIAVELLRQAAGHEHFQADAAVAIADALGYLPLALSSLATQIRSRPRWDLTDHLEWLMNAPVRAGHTADTGPVVDRAELAQRFRLDPRVELALNLSYDGLPEPVRRTLRLLGLHPGGDAGADSVAALADVDLDTAHEHLDQLVAANLLQKSDRGRFEPHDLVRAYAAMRTHDEDRRIDREAALTRLFDHYVARARRACDPTSDTDEGAAWLATERPNVLAIAVHAADHGLDYAPVLAEIVNHALLDAGHYQELLVVHSAALRTCRERSDLMGESRARGHLGAVYDELGQYPLALDNLDSALLLAQQVGDSRQEAQVLGYLGTVNVRLGNPDLAAGQYQRAIDVALAQGDVAAAHRTLNNLGIVHLIKGEWRHAIDCWQRVARFYRDNSWDDFSVTPHQQALAQVLGNLGIASERLGNYDDALQFHHEAAEIFTTLGSPPNLGAALDNLGVVHRRLCQYDESLVHHRRALDIFREIGSRANEAEALSHFAVTCHLLGRSQEALAHHEAALAIAREIGDKHMLAEFLNSLSETLQGLGNPERALEHARTALAVATEHGDRFEVARAHAAVGNAVADQSDIAGARQHWREALVIYTALSAPEAAAIRSRLDSA